MPPRRTRGRSVVVSHSAGNVIESAKASKSTGRKQAKGKAKEERTTKAEEKTAKAKGRSRQQVDADADMAGEEVESEEASQVEQEEDDVDVAEFIQGEIQRNPSYFTETEWQELSLALRLYIDIFPKLRGANARRSARAAMQWRSIQAIASEKLGEHAVRVVDAEGQLQCKLALKYSDGIRVLNRYITFCGGAVQAFDHALSISRRPSQSKPQELEWDPWEGREHIALTGVVLRDIRDAVVRWQNVNDSKKGTERLENFNPYLHLWLAALYTTPNDFTGGGFEKWKDSVVSKPTEFDWSTWATKHKMVFVYGIIEDEDDGLPVVETVDATLKVEFERISESATKAVKVWKAAAHSGHTSKVTEMASDMPSFSSASHSSMGAKGAPAATSNVQKMQVDEEANNSKAIVSRREHVATGIGSSFGPSQSRQSTQLPSAAPREGPMHDKSSEDSSLGFDISDNGKGALTPMVSLIAVTMGGMVATVLSASTMTP